MRTSSATTGMDLFALGKNGRGSVYAICLLAVALLGISIAAFIVAVPPAFAVTEGRAYSFSFGSPGSGNGQFAGALGEGLAIDQSTGDVYVADTPHARIEKFDSSGHFISAWGYGVLDGNTESEVCEPPSACRVGVPGNGPGQFQYPTGIAVDNSSGPNHGDVYVADTASSPFNTGPAQPLNYILKFASNGEYLGIIDGHDSPGGVFTSLSFDDVIAIDGLGSLYVTTAGRLLKFDATSRNEYVEASELPHGGPHTLAVNSIGTRLLDVEDEGSIIVNASGLPQSQTLPCGGQFSGAATFDQASNHFFVASSNSICEFDTEGRQISQFIVSENAFSAAGIAVNEATGDVYVMNQASSQVGVFVPRIIPDVVTEAPTSVGHTTATLNGEVAPDPAGGGNVTGCTFQYMPNEQFEQYRQSVGTEEAFSLHAASIPCSPSAPLGASTVVSADLSGLEPETAYVYRVSAENSFGSAYGVTRTFMLHWVLGINTEPATMIAPTVATLNGSFESTGEDTHYYFEWGATQSYGQNTATPPGLDAEAGEHEVSATLTGLTPYTSYHYRLVAQNNVGTSYGQDQVLRTAPPPLPLINEESVPEVAATTALVDALVNPNLGPTVYRVQYGHDRSYGVESKASEPLPEDATDHHVVVELAELQPGTTYHARLLATNFGGTSYGPDITFTTQGPPAVLGLPASAVGQTAATLQAQVNPSFTVTTVRFEYGQSSSYGLRTAEKDVSLNVSDATFHLVSMTVDGLQPHTTYHFRVVATNIVGVTEGTDETFTTEALSSEQPLPQPRCKKGYRVEHGHCRRKRHHVKRRHKGKHATRA